jgi:hypothetical protein
MNTFWGGPEDPNITATAHTSTIRVAIFVDAPPQKTFTSGKCISQEPQEPAFPGYARHSALLIT